MAQTTGVVVCGNYDRQARAVEPIAHHREWIDLCAMLRVLRAERLGVITHHRRTSQARLPHELPKERLFPGAPQQDIGIP
jgi:hypothetical protein